MIDKVDRVGFEPTTSAYFILVHQRLVKESLFKSHPLHRLDAIHSRYELEQKKWESVHYADFSNCIWIIDGVGIKALMILIKIIDKE